MMNRDKIRQHDASESVSNDAFQTTFAHATKRSEQIAPEADTMRTPQQVYKSVEYVKP